jgi:hypothetical protein
VGKVGIVLLGCDIAQRSEAQFSEDATNGCIPVVDPRPRENRPALYTTITVGKSKLHQRNRGPRLPSHVPLRWSARAPQWALPPCTPTIPRQHHSNQSTSILDKPVLSLLRPPSSGPRKVPVEYTHTGVAARPATYKRFPRSRPTAKKTQLHSQTAHHAPPERSTPGSQQERKAMPVRGQTRASLFPMAIHTRPSAHVHTRPSADAAVEDVFECS